MNIDELVKFVNGFRSANAEKTDIKVLNSGVAIGTVFLADSFVKDIPTRQIAAADVSKEFSRLDKAVANVKAALTAKKEQLTTQQMENEASIFDAHIIMLEDNELLKDVKETMAKKLIGIEKVYQERTYSLAEQFRTIQDPYISDKAVDILDIANQVLDELMGTPRINPDELTDLILVARDVSPSMITHWREGQLKGVITTNGGDSSHIVILAKALGIPLITGYSITADIQNGQIIMFDTDTKEVVISPSDELLKVYHERYNEWQQQIIQDAEDSKGDAITKDGVKIEIFANVGDELTAKLAALNGAEGIGLLRTEFLFMNMHHEPKQEEQVEKLRDIFSYHKGKPITVRTLDVGGDKELAWLKQPRELNPFLGVRGVRLYQRHKELFATQIKSILCAGVGYNIKIMIPMVSTPLEIKFVRNIIESAHIELTSAEIEHLWPVELGIMIETPSSVLCAEEMAKMVDFFSIGTNDLCQYIMSAERGGSLSSLLDYTQPAILRSIRYVAEAAKSAGIGLSVCGEMAGEGLGAKLLLGFGIQALSMNSTAIGAIKRTVRTCSIDGLKHRVAECVAIIDPEKVKEIMK